MTDIAFKPYGTTDLTPEQVGIQKNVPIGSITQISINFSTPALTQHNPIYLVPDGKTLLIQNITCCIKTTGNAQINLYKYSGDIITGGNKIPIYREFPTNPQNQSVSLTFPKGYYIYNSEGIGVFSTNVAQSTTILIHGVLIDNSLSDFILQKSYGF